MKYSLVHCTNHSRGRELMKEAMWKVSGGTFAIYQSHDPGQMSLIEPKPDLTLLKSAVLEALPQSGMLYNDLEGDWLLRQNWLPTHLKKALKELRKAGQVEITEYTGRFAFGKNPLIAPSRRSRR